jgi:hypothetical protein
VFSGKISTAGEGKPSVSDERQSMKDIFHEVHCPFSARFESGFIYFGAATSAGLEAVKR